MDLEGWEIIPEHGFLEIHDDGGKKIFSRKCYMDSNTIIQNNYFGQSSQLADESEPSFRPNDQLSLPDDDHDHGSELARMIKILPERIKFPVPFEAEQEISEVSIKKMDEEEIAANLKMDSPRSSKAIIVPQMDAAVQKNGRINIWRWRLNGIGTICSFGVAAAATLCIIFIGNGQKHRQQNQKTCFQIYPGDKKQIKQVHPATKFNEAN